ncbi:hypothetical protein F5Y04DRAFT_46904 [Hypomontagnella monticulosa]|nr:hypothetical protein F5Y04DRAFT_46904 [Hypomontagnella monticulosa]
MRPSRQNTFTTPDTYKSARRICKYKCDKMEDMRDAKDTVAIFTDYIGRLRPEETRPHSADLLSFNFSSATTVKRQGSTNSAGSGSSSTTRRTSAKWNRSVGKEWSESPSGTIWHQISSTIEDVAAEFPEVNATAIKEFISAREVLELGADFVQQYRRGRFANDKTHWSAEDLFFDLEGVKQGDLRASRWTQARPEKRAEWDLADHITRFVLAADDFRKRADRDDWNTWGGDFAREISFYLCILRCFTVRDAKQRQAARDRDGTRVSEQQAQQAQQALQAKRKSYSGHTRLSRHGK